MSEHRDGDRIEHERYGLGTVETRANTAHGYETTGHPTTSTARVRIRWDDPNGGPEVSTVLTGNVQTTTAL